MKARILLASVIPMILLSIAGCKQTIPTEPLANPHDPQTAAFSPYGPTSLSLVADTGSVPTLRWKDSSNFITQFVVERRGSAGTFTEVSRVPRSSFQFRDTSASQITDYVYRVSAVADTHRSAPSNEVSAGYRPRITLARSITAAGGFFSLSPDGRQIIAQAGGGGGNPPSTYRLIDASSGQLLQTFRRDSVSASTTCPPLFMPDGKSVLLSYSDATVCLWNVASGGIVSRFTRTGGPFGTIAVQGYVESMDVSPDGNLLAVGIFDLAEVDVWNITSGTIVQRIPVGPIGDASPYAAFSTDGRSLVVLSGGSSTIWNTADWSSRTLPITSEFGNGLMFNSSSTLLGWTYTIGFTVFDLSSGSAWGTANYGGGGTKPGWSAFLPARPYFLVSLAMDDNRISVYRLSDAKQVSTLTCAALAGCFRLTADGRQLFVSNGVSIDVYHVDFGWAEVGP